MNAARSDPAAPTEKISPIDPGDRCSSRTANTRKIENARLQKKFDVAVQPACARRFGFRRTKRRPSSDRSQADLRPSTVGTRGVLDLADAEHEEARADEAQRVDEDRARRGEDLDQRPPNPGPAICAAERLISSFELPSTICSRSTSDGRYDWYATSKKTVADADEEPDDEELRRW